RSAAWAVSRAQGRKKSENKQARRQADWSRWFMVKVRRWKSAQGFARHTCSLCEDACGRNHPAGAGLLTKPGFTPLVAWSGDMALQKNTVCVCRPPESDLVAGPGRCRWQRRGHDGVDRFLHQTTELKKLPAACGED